MPGFAECAGRLAALLGIPCKGVDIHSFPDGESLVTVRNSAHTAILYCSLDYPNTKLVELTLAAAALRDQGVERLILMAPYLCYMRQDTAFHAGEAVSQRVIGNWLAGLFDRIITVDPHLHRTPDIKDVFPGAEADALSATSALAGLIRDDNCSEDFVLVGPDGESRQWVQQIAALLSVPMLIGDKVRDGDRRVRIDIPHREQVSGRIAYVVDDVVSSGVTLATSAELLIESGASRVEVIVVHALCGPDDLTRMKNAGIARLRSTDSVLHPTNAVSLAPLLAGALENEVG
ncbi:MAG: ribose-phosphate diphosphokinase [Rhodospirillaceae bacterium]|nr:ribose-phosphate diphosphokinase [Rhodospirillaceae bacterium]MBT5455454.1 ribose-phosphate diphosphokinase [Rhodospirillaceae bacterium]